jgi:hypothetical protein
MKPSSYWGYLAAAFNARPFGMFVAPNWIGLAAFGLLGMTNPGFWLIGAGAEVAYLIGLSGSRRFQQTVDRRAAGQSESAWQKKHDELVGRLADQDQARYVALVTRCRAVLDQLSQHDRLGASMAVQSENLSRLTWVYLRLLLARRGMLRVLRDPGLDETMEIETKLKDLKARLAAPDLSDDLRRSLSSQADILAQRVDQRKGGRERLAFLESEIERIQEQVELLREQAAMATGSEGLSQRIDEIAATLGGTTQWISDQQRVLGSMDDLLDEPPPAITRLKARESA